MKLSSIPHRRADAERSASAESGGWESPSRPEALRDTRPLLQVWLQWIARHRVRAEARRLIEAVGGIPGSAPVGRSPLLSPSTPTPGG